MKGSGRVHTHQLRPPITAAVCVGTCPVCLLGLQEGGFTVLKTQFQLKRALCERTNCVVCSRSEASPHELSLLMLVGVVMSFRMEGLCSLELQAALAAISIEHLSL